MVTGDRSSCPFTQQISQHPINLTPKTKKAPTASVILRLKAVKWPRKNLLILVSHYDATFSTTFHYDRVRIL